MIVFATRLPATVTVVVASLNVKNGLPPNVPISLY